MIRPPLSLPSLCQTRVELEKNDPLGRIRPDVRQQRASSREAFSRDPERDPRRFAIRIKDEASTAARFTMVARTMEAFCTESTRLRDAIGNDEPPDQYGGVEWLLNEELLATADPPPFSWKDLLALLDQQRIVWISSRVFLVRENLIHDGRAFSDWVGGGGYACLFGIGGSTAGDYISLYAAAERTPAQTTTARNFLVDLFCLGEGDSAVLVGSGG